MKLLPLILVLTAALPALAMPAGPADCGDMELWDYDSGMCMPFAMEGMPMSMVMIHGNAFATQIHQTGPRGRDSFAIPNMLMVDVGRSVGPDHYVNFEFMGTLEKWSFPERGYPELLQIGEEDENGLPFLDAQHPHSSPVMGLTISDTITLEDGKDHMKIWFSPRGQSTDGPVAFMHRPTGMMNPDAPLGHHVGQDAGHITSTVIGGLVNIGSTTVEASAFHGEEPEPTKVDLPLGPPNSYALRLIKQFTPHVYAMTSAAFVKEPEHHDPDLDHIWRYSASIGTQTQLASGWTYHNTLILGLVNGYDDAAALASVNEEFWFKREARNIWGRVEHLQRTPNELFVIGPADADEGRWVTAITLGYTHTLKSWESGALGLGASVTQDILPSEFRDAYGGNPTTAKIFLQIGGMTMRDL